MPETKSTSKSTTSYQNMDPIKLQIRSSSRSTALFSRNPRQTKPLPSFIAVSIAISIALFVFVYIFFFSSKDSVKYSIIIDGGSTGTRIHVFRYNIDGDRNPVFDFKEGLESLKVNPGLSAYSEDLEGAADLLKELLEFGRSKVPESQWGETEIRLMATAGLRLLDDEVQERILEQCRKVLRLSGFKFRDVWASVITGSDEGVYAWVVANYVFGTLGGNPQHTTGIIELGGASAQVTFFSTEPMPSEFSRSIKFGNFTYSLYSHSFLHFGQNVARNSLRESLIKGDFSPAAESIHKETYRSLYTKRILARFIKPFVRSAALMLLQKGKEKCSSGLCYLGSVFMPKLQGKFWLQKISSIPQRLSFANQVNDIPLDWALGAFILQSATNLDVLHTNWITNIINSDSTIFSVIAISVILMFSVWSISKWRKPQLKTVYDLEKGRYIVTRINRS
ncbi:GDA1/CD39 nucleoside phosphatase family protein, putative isoform 2 [Hibiscus syriacus]|uniref:apyrase n=1 Tax=Hibiscus syriacus TaxID=106335 RepID=A0A6A3CAT3_HIBSY|nr:GDA1/CD39 nucleoside phosphatase family protein, putative isoform 2 [Hibiscus syriacus]